ncbi:MAG TPA: M48 family metallopeptidase [Terriglobales bacterium]|nr:M48 family metallopeptidase [Terriglobales bacterium]
MAQVMHVTAVQPTAQAPAKPQPPFKSYHDHSIRDIDDIGNRNIGCSRGIGNWYSLERQIEMGKQYSDQVIQTSRLITDPEVTDYVNRVGQNLVRHSDSVVPFTIRVIDSDDVNAFALPGGFFFIDSGLIEAADNEAELAGVMAHEIAHVAACHMARQTTRGKLMNMASIPLMMIGGPIGYAGYEALTVAMPLSYMRFSRHFESEADYLGVQYMYKAGYDPQALTAFFEKIKVMEKGKEGVVAKAFRTHPQTPDRIQKTQAEINTLLPPQTQYVVDTSDFEDTKVELQKLENRGNLQLQNANRPTLRRREFPEEQN